MTISARPLSPQEVRDIIVEHFNVFIDLGIRRSTADETLAAAVSQAVFHNADVVNHIAALGLGISRQTAADIGGFGARVCALHIMHLTEKSPWTDEIVRIFYQEIAPHLFGPPAKTALHLQVVK